MGLTQLHALLSELAQDRFRGTQRRPVFHRTDQSKQAFVQVHEVGKTAPFPVAGAGDQAGQGGWGGCLLVAGEAESISVPLSQPRPRGHCSSSGICGGGNLPSQ